MSLPASQNLLEELNVHASQPTTSVSLRVLYEFARGHDEKLILQAARFLHREMLIRLAKKVRELEEIPCGLGGTRWIQVVRDWYVQSYVEMAEFPEPRSLEENDAFCEMIDKIKNRHRNQVAVMARGIREYLDHEGLTVLSPELQAFLDSFFLSRIGIRVLLGHHAAAGRPREGWAGIIQAQTSPHEVAIEAAGNAAQMCRQTYGDPPVVKFHGRLNLRFKYIPSHLHHILFELFKNSFRATVETHEGRAKLPSVHVVIAGGMEDVSIKVSDAGGGIPRSLMDRIWTYAFTTAKPVAGAMNSQPDIMAGLGYGLPLSRLYSRYFGGDLQLISLEGHGTDAYVHLSRLGTHQEYVL